MGNGLVNGIRFRPTEGADWVNFSFASDGRISGMVVTEDLGAMAHVRLVTLLRDLEKDVPDLKVTDLTGYWDTENAAGLTDYFEQVRTSLSQPEEAAAPRRRRPKQGDGDSRSLVVPLAAVSVIGLGIYLFIMAFRGARR
jgi:hypothetical protein